jgi:hypothetical protein
MPYRKPGKRKLASRPRALAGTGFVLHSLALDTPTLSLESQKPSHRPSNRLPQASDEEACVWDSATSPNPTNSQCLWAPAQASTTDDRPKCNGMTL